MEFGIHVLSKLFVTVSLLLTTFAIIGYLAASGDAFWISILGYAGLFSGCHINCNLIDGDQPARSWVEAEIDLLHVAPQRQEREDAREPTVVTVTG